MEKILDTRTIDQIKQAFVQLKEPVQILFFGTEDNCAYCGEIRQLLEEVTELNDKLGLEIHDLQADAALAAQYNVDKAPCIVVTAKDGEKLTNLGIQFAGVSSGYEFSTFINDLLLASNRDSGLSQKTREFLQKLEKPLHLQIFVTPT